MRRFITWALVVIFSGLWVTVGIKNVLELSVRDQKSFFFRLIVFLLVVGFGMLKKGKKPEKKTESTKPIQVNLLEVTMKSKKSMNPT